MEGVSVSRAKATTSIASELRGRFSSGVPSDWQIFCYVSKSPVYHDFKRLSASDRTSCMSNLWEMRIVVATVAKSAWPSSP